MFIELAYEGYSALLPPSLHRDVGFDGGLPVVLVRRSETEEQVRLFRAFAPRFDAIVVFF